MKAVDSDKFEISMAGELDKMWEFMRLLKDEGHSILRSVWSHRLRCLYNAIDHVSVLTKAHKSTVI